ncbi:hypothetical protein RCL1_008730 [Eukaryota sp. TZLM3-RCL]
MLLSILVATLPPCVCNIVGLLVVKLKVLPSLSIEYFNSLIFKVCIPALLVASLSELEVTPQLRSFFFLQVLFRFITFIIAFLISTQLRLSKSQVPFKINVYAFFSTTAWANGIVLGIPLIESLFSKEAVIYALICGSVDYCVHVIVGSFVLSDGANVKQVVKKVVTKPAVVAVFVGLSFSFLKITLHPIIANSLYYMSSIVKGSAHIVAGMELCVTLFEHHNIFSRFAEKNLESKQVPLLSLTEDENDLDGIIFTKENYQFETVLDQRLEVVTDPFDVRYLSLLIGCKVVLAPLLMFILGKLLRLDDVAFQMAVFISCLPPSLSAFVLARSFNKCVAASNFVIVLITLLFPPLALLYGLIFNWSFQ